MTVSRRSYLGIAATCLTMTKSIKTENTPTVFEKQLRDVEPLLYLGEDARTKLRPGWIFDRIRWRDEWTTRDPVELDDFETYESDGYLVTIQVTPRMDDADVLTESDLAFESTGLNTGEPTLLREKLPDAGMFEHPTEAIPLLEPSETFDYHIPSGVVVEVEANDAALTYGVKTDGGGMVGKNVYLPEMDEWVGASEKTEEIDGESDT